MNTLWLDTPENRDRVLTLLHEGKLNLNIIKADESRRTILATLSAQYIKPYEKTTDRTKTPNPDVQPVWDMENDSFRSFRWDRLHSWALDVDPEEINLR